MEHGECVVPSSFRDPSGEVFSHGGTIYRRINGVYREHYDRLMQSGLYRDLVDAGLLIPHEETADPVAADRDGDCKTIRPERVPFISYPYEWCFSELKHAALATLKILRRALDADMTLKDGSAYNIQFVEGRPVLIDTLSFETYREGRPWVAYRQFCQHFLAPLALMSLRDVRLNQLLRVHLDGIPLDLASALLPMSSYFGFRLALHIHFQARSQKRYAGKQVSHDAHVLSRFRLLALLDSLERAISGLTWSPQGTAWADYYDSNRYSSAGMASKKRLVSEYLKALDPKSVWDMGANEGEFSRVATEMRIPVVAFDMDPAAVEKNYLNCTARGDRLLLPLLMDLTNPSPAIGWEHTERMSLAERGPSDAVLALALVHHLRISNNLPLHRIAEWFSRICNSLITEFVPKSDSQVRRLLATREDIFDDYTEAAFQEHFEKFFTIRRRETIADSDRSLYLMTSRSH